MGLFSRRKSGQVYIDMFERTYEMELAHLAGSVPTPEEFAAAHLEAIDEAQLAVSRTGVFIDKDYYDKDWLVRSARQKGINLEAALAARLELKYDSSRESKEEDSPTSRKLILTDDGRGVLIFGRREGDSNSSWTYRADPGIDFFVVEDLVQKEANHMDIDLGLPISWTIWQDDADEYARSPEEYEKKRERKPIEELDPSEVGVCPKCGKTMRLKDVAWCLC